jgi:hypothetical protein
MRAMLEDFFSTSIPDLMVFPGNWVDSAGASPLATASCAAPAGTGCNAPQTAACPSPQ